MDLDRHDDCAVINALPPPMGALLNSGLSSNNKDENRLLLTLVDVSDLVGRDGVGDDVLLKQQWQTLSSRVGCCAAAEMDAPVSKDDETLIEKHIFSFLKRSDRYMAFASVLLKSRSYYLATDPSCDAEAPHPETHRNQRSIRQLPRTEHGKPFIPNCHHLINISHQYPFVGIAHGRRCSDKVSIGMDIVVFDPYQRQLYANLQEFLECFSDSFTDHEWKMIRSVRKSCGDDEALREFYLQWAAKEAYTKALGVGLGFNFGSFHVVFDAVEVASHGGLWKAVISATAADQAYRDRACSFRGSIVERDSPQKKQMALFYFVPLRDMRGAMGDNSPFQGCACICVTGGRNGTDTVRLGIDWQTIDDLSLFHIRCEMT